MKNIESRHRRVYTEEELMYLEASWGKHSVSKIARELGRTEVAIKLKACRLGLGNPLDSKDYLIAKEVERLLGTNRKTLKKHLENRGLKHKTKILENKRLVMVTFDNLIDWMVNNKKYWNGTRVDKLGLLAIGFDEKILNEKIKEDTIKEKRTTLTDKEKEKVKELYKQYITYEGIALKLNKEFSTIKWFLHTSIANGELEKNCDSNRLVRVTKRENYGWTEWQDRILITEFRNGKTLREISKKVGKSLSATKSRNQVLSKRLIKGLAI